MHLQLSCGKDAPLPMTRSELALLSERFACDELKRRLPSGTAVYLFGSRARQMNFWNSDYDIWVDADLPQELINDILEEFDESFVPFKVDIVDPQAAGSLWGCCQI